MTNFAVRKSKESRVKKHLNHFIVATFCFLFLIGSSQSVWSQNGNNHNHDSHAGHNHGDHSGHNHGHEGHNHGDHAGHNHGDHAGHNHDSHAGHNHGADHSDHGHGHDAHGSSTEFNPSEVIMHHIADSHEFHLFGKAHLPLPVILYVPGQGLVSGMSSAFHGQGKDGFSLHHDVFSSKGGYEKATVMNLFNKDVKKFYDFSITKNVFTMFLAGFILCLIFFSVARAYKRREGQAPKGLQNFMEPFFTFIRDEVAKPNIPDAWEKYLPFLMTLFFFILACNLFGLVPFFPGSANVTGNIAFTMVLAVFTFLITTFSGTKHYWQHILWMPGVPVLVKPILAVVEFAGIFIKPFSLMIRLFANITGGHIIILSLISLIFIFGKMGTSVLGAGAGVGLSVPFVIFMNAIELFVAFLQAFIFTILAALYIGQAVEVAHDDHH